MVVVLHDKLVEETAEDPEGGVGGWLGEEGQEGFSEDGEVFPHGGIEDWGKSGRLRVVRRVRRTPYRVRRTPGGVGRWSVRLT
jgi:hypothetical protein